MTEGPDDAALRYDTVTFLSDYGRTDEFVGVVHSVIRQMAPGVGIVDLTHDIPPFDIRTASLTLARSAQYLCPGVVMAVVDPAVGTDRRAVAVEIGDGAAVLIGPDNGVLAGAVAMVGGAQRAVVLDDPRFHLAPPGPTFDGRDVFAPVAAHLCLGTPFEELGTAIDPVSLMPGVMPLAEVTESKIDAEVLWVDRYGNAQLNVDPDDLSTWGDRVQLTIEDRRRTGRRVRTFAEVGVGEIGLICDSYGLLAMVANKSSAADELSIRGGSAVCLEPLEGTESAPAVRVELGRRSERPAK